MCDYSFRLEDQEWYNSEPDVICELCGRVVVGEIVVLAGKPVCRECHDITPEQRAVEENDQIAAQQDFEMNHAWKLDEPLPDGFPV